MEYNINQWYQDQLFPSRKESSWGYMFTSTMLHALGLTAAILFASILPQPPELKPLMEITILEAAGEPTKADTSFAEGIQQTQSQNQMVDKDAVIVSKQKKVAKKISRAKLKANKKQSLVKRPTFAVKRVIHGPTVKESEIEAPILETEEFEQTLKSDVKFHAKKFDENSISEDLEKVDRENSYKVAALQKDLDKQADDFMSEQEEDMKNLSQDVIQSNAQLKEQIDNNKKADLAKVAQAKEAEELAQKRAAAQAEKDSQASALARSYGVNGRVRSLEDIKQMPGNRKPYYDPEDRLARRQGAVSFLAYVSKDGKITQFKLLQGTGHRTLDAKTLNAIRSWRFYPGQEGWVEIPFKWDLKGGPQEMPATLRRKISQK
jgi:TonB family protein